MRFELQIENFLICQIIWLYQRTNNLNTLDISRCSVVSSKLTIFVFFCVPPFRCDVPFKNKIITKHLKCYVFFLQARSVKPKKWEKKFSHISFRSPLFHFQYCREFLGFYFILPGKCHINFNFYKFFSDFIQFFSYILFY